MTMLDDTLQKAAAIVRGVRKLTVLTGAGVSRESGIPTFRDALEGLWAQFDPRDLATRDAFRTNPALVWQFYAQRLRGVHQTQPNPGHYALAALEKRFGSIPIITQNVDNLHEIAGSTQVIHLHGQINRHKCFNACKGEPTLIDIATLPDKEASPPRCPHCGSYVRPDVVWFGEMLPPDAVQAANDALNCDVLLVIGTSGAVYPAAEMPLIAMRHGAKVIDVNPNESDAPWVPDVWIAAPSGEALPRLVEMLENPT
ncbi:MAG: NAD-dependent deacylase [Anaerolineae bacterium]